MKTIIKYFMITCVAVSVIACSDIIESEEDLVFPEREIILTATREGLQPGTRSFRLDDGSVWWSPNEEVSVFYGEGSNGGSKFVSMNTSIAETVELQGSVQMSGSGKDFWAVYPYSEDNSCDGSSVTTVIPDQQTAVEGNFSNDVFPTIAKSSSLSLAFWNICGGIKFFVSRNDITSVTFKGNNSEPLAGKVKVSFDTDGKPYIAEVIDAKFEVTLNAPDGAFKVGKYYYITLLPASLQNGFTMAFETTDMRGSVVTQKTQAIKRSVFGVLKNIDSTVSDWESMLIVEPEWVDLGLSVKWATFNVGASKPEEYGDYFAWGETEPKGNFTWKSYKYRVSGNSRDNVIFNKYNVSSSYGTVDNKTVLDSEDDAAHVNWGGSWRMPTDAEWTELRANCTWAWTRNYNGIGVAGMIVTSNKSGYTEKSIFLPAAGIFVDTYLYYAGSFGYKGYYWSSSLYTDYPSYAYDVCFDSSHVSWDYYDRLSGQSVRPVCPKNSGDEALSIKIDGDLSDWDAVQGTSNGTFGSFKAASDDKNLYFYCHRTTEGRYSDIWGGTGYIYVGFELDNNPANNTAKLWASEAYDLLFLVYPYGGTAAAPAITVAAGEAGVCEPSPSTVANVVCKGQVNGDGAFIEFSVPRADISKIPSSEITISAWGNKDLAKVELKCSL